MKLYATSKSGHVFVRNTDNPYTYAVIGPAKNGTLTDYSWHRRYDLARKSALVPSRVEIVEVTHEAHGICGRCDGTGQITCTKCRGKIEGDRILYTYEKDADGNMLIVNNHSVPKQVVTGHWVCSCETGKVKCHVCRGKGRINTVESK